MVLMAECKESQNKCEKEITTLADVEKNLIQLEEDLSRILEYTDETSDKMRYGSTSEKPCSETADGHSGERIERLNYSIDGCRQKVESLGYILREINRRL